MSSSNVFCLCSCVFLLVLFSFSQPSNSYDFVSPKSNLGFNVTLEDHGFVLYPSAQANASSVVYYRLTLGLLKENNGDGDLIQSVAATNGVWSAYETNDMYQSRNYTTQLQLYGQPEPVNLTINTFLFNKDYSMPYGDLDFLEFFVGDFGFLTHLTHWPFQSPDNRLTIRYRLKKMVNNITITGENLIWEGEISPVGHIDGMTVFADHPLELGFPILALTDDQKTYTGVGIDDVHDALEINFHFANYNNDLSYLVKASVLSSSYDSYTTSLIIGIVVVAAILGIGYFGINWYKNRNTPTEV